MSGAWPREMAGHLIDRETSVRVGRNADIQERFHCVDCGRTFDEEPDADALREVPCEASPAESET